MNHIKILKSFKVDPFTGKIQHWPFFKVKFTSPLHVVNCYHFLTKMDKDKVKDADYLTVASAIFGHLVGLLPEDLLVLVIALPPWSKSQMPELEDGKADVEFMPCPHPSTVWSLLLKKYENNTSVHKRLLIKQLIQAKMDKEFDFFEASISQIVNRLSSMGETISDALRLGILLSGLPPSADAIVSVIDSDEKYDYNTAVATLSNHFSREAAKSQADQPSTADVPQAYAASVRPSFKRPYCTHCKEHGHKDTSCWELHPDLKPEHLRGRPKRGSQEAKPCGDSKCACHQDHASSSSATPAFVHLLQTVDSL